MRAHLLRRLRQLETATRTVLPWSQPLREWTTEQRDALDDLNRRGFRLDEAHALALDDIANDPDPEREDRGRA